MNTETNQDNSATPSTGERLRSAREQMGLTQQNVAERLCLKRSTVRDIEEDRPPAGLALTFLRGYIRSYARLVHVPEEELLPALAKQVPTRTGKVEPPMQSFSRGRRRKKSDCWLMIFTWLVVLVVISLTGAWWWQNHKAARNDLISLGQQNSAGSVDNTLSLAQADNGASDTHSAPVPAENSSAADNPVTDNAAPAIPTTLPAPQVPASQSAASSPAPVDNQAGTDNQLAANDADTSTPPGDPNAIVLDFTNDCWLEVTDAAGKKLFSGIQHNGGKLSLAGTAPYQLKIGAPAAVQIQFQGQPVDLSHFIRTNQVARLTLGAR